MLNSAFSNIDFTGKVYYGSSASNSEAGKREVAKNILNCPKVIRDEVIDELNSLKAEFEENTDEGNSYGIEFKCKASDSWGHPAYMSINMKDITNPNHSIDLASAQENISYDMDKLLEFFEEDKLKEAVTKLFSRTKAKARKNITEEKNGETIKSILNRLA